METYVSSKGQIVIPADMRRKYGIKSGTRIEIYDDGERIILRPVTPEYIRSLRGSLKGGGALKILKEERRKEMEE
ncbi:MAG TPA: AbrB/MazE/SpoVT family DNA-binding domain-containing protein [Anaerolineales bacterium]